MNCNLPKITYPTLRSLLLLRICEAIYPKSDVEVANRSVADPHLLTEQRNFRILAPHSILKRVKNKTSVAAYSSSIALQLGAESAHLREEIVGRILDSLTLLQHPSSDLLEQDIEKMLLRDLTVITPETGRLVFEFGDRAIAVYLQNVLSHCTAQLDEAPIEASLALDRDLSDNSKVFLCQYSYARCAALIRMHPLSIYIGKSVENASAIWPKNCRLSFEQAEALLAYQIITTLDEWQDQPALDLAVALSEVFQTFYRSCQIVKYDAINLQLAQCRLGLVMITHGLLKQLLQYGLGVLAPAAL